MPNALGQMPQAIRIVFACTRYVALGVGIFVAMLVTLLAASDYVFFEPYVVSHIPQGGEFGLVLIITIAILSALVIPAGIMSVQSARAARKGFAGSITGTTIGIAAGACSCGPLGFALVSSLGAAGSATASFLTAYDVPLRLVAITALVVSLYTISSAITRECKI